MNIDTISNIYENGQNNERVMPEDKLKEAIDNFLNSHSTCALATGYDGIIRNTPIEYNWFDDCFWMLSEGGKKFENIAHNPKVSLAIFDNFTSWNELKGMQVFGTASLIAPLSDDYIAASNKMGVSEDILNKLPNILPIIKIVPSQIIFLNSNFKNQGYRLRQDLNFN